MRFLLISLCILVLNCGSYPKKQNFQTNDSALKNIKNPYFSDVNRDYIYKASIDVYGKNFGGLLIIKKITDNQHRIAFTTEMGSKLFDFTFTEDDFKVNFILDELNKKMLINILKKDFKVLVTENIDVLNGFSEANNSVYEAFIYHKSYYYFDNIQLAKVIRVKNGKENVQFLFSKINNHIAEQIEIKHRNINLEIKLKSITQ